MTRPRRTTRAFSLVELVVALSVLGVLLAAAVPAFTGMRATFADRALVASLTDAIQDADLQAASDLNMEVPYVMYRLGAPGMRSTVLGSDMHGITPMLPVILTGPQATNTIQVFTAQGAYATVIGVATADGYRVRAFPGVPALDAPVNQNPAGGVFWNPANGGTVNDELTTITDFAPTYPM